ncbi:MAG: glycine--tRNA ligase subunit beta [Ectothiorhodospiraceae bacterium]|nr:glycine--tRNA ligase subunit beta [Ectothiorhodospiraceae bacterium]
MVESRDFLVEIGTEELPPKALPTLSAAFGRELSAALTARNLTHGAVELLATPRRLAVIVRGLATAQPDREIERRGPALAVAFDADGGPTKAALGFARSCRVEVDHLERLENDQGAWLVFRSTEVGEPTTSLLPSVVGEALAKLPIPRRMRWADLDAEFVRPVHWVVMLLGGEVVPAEILGVGAGRTTRGHRFHHPDPLPLETPDDYVTKLHGQGWVVPDFAARRELIRTQIGEAAATVGGHALVDDGLLDEVTALVEWPVAVVAGFDHEYLELPAAVVRATMEGHQRYFPLVDDAGALLPHFVTISNIQSRNPAAVRDGNERVIRPRLADAAFFFRTDVATSLGELQTGLENVVYQDRLGSLADKSRRVARLAGHVAIAMGLDPEAVRQARRAASLGRCDLLTRMVGEFPELQGTMGAEYARRAGEPEQVAAAIGELYHPRFAGDAIPDTALGQALAIADRLDTLVGIFGIGQAPTGDRDPFALRRAALGALRIMIEGALDLDLPKLLRAAAEGHDAGFDAEGTARDVGAFMVERLRGYFVDAGIPVQVFLAVQAREPSRPYDFAQRVHAVDEFHRLPEAASLAAANKRIQNILRQAGDAAIPDAPDESMYAEDAEWNLAAKLVGLGPRARDLLRARDYKGAMGLLAGLRDAVDAFFDSVKVMDDDPAVRANRLALLATISGLFMETADISKLQD